MIYKVSSGSEWHSTEKRSAHVYLNGVAIYSVLKPLNEGVWDFVGNKGKHGKWFTAFYDIPDGTECVFIAKANGRPDKTVSFIAGNDEDLDIDGFLYAGEPCGWIVARKKEDIK